MSEKTINCEREKFHIQTRRNVSRARALRDEKGANGGHEYSGRRNRPADILIRGNACRFLLPAE